MLEKIAEDQEAPTVGATALAADAPAVYLFWLFCRTAL